MSVKDTLRMAHKFDINITPVGKANKVWKLMTS